jgi:S-adenosylmethionine:tRNA ribosyltransferase-isomerase
MAQEPNRYHTDDFDYEYPLEAVAQRPLADRSASRLLVLNRGSGEIRHTTFKSFSDLPDPGDVLVLNVSRVVPARLTGRRENGRDAEILLVHADEDGSWTCLAHPGGKLKVGRKVFFGENTTAEVIDVLGGGLRRIRFHGALGASELMEEFGAVPLPPYITRPPDTDDSDRYQTVYATEDGSVAAPTAGLHFTEETLDELKSRGVKIAEVLLHVGPGTFKPVRDEDPSLHKMHAEWYSVTNETAELINETKAAGQRVWAVGTTSARVLESVAVDGILRGESGWTELFILPPYEFKMVDAMLTNFHLPRSTLLMLVAAFSGFDLMMNTYREAVELGYRLYSYGDAMAIV